MGRDSDKKFKISQEHNIDSFRRQRCNFTNKLLTFSKSGDCLVEQECPDFSGWLREKFQNKALVSAE